MDTTFTFNIKAVSDMKDVVSNIENIQGALNKLKLPDNMKASFDKTFKSLLREVENYQTILNKPNKTKGDITGLEKSSAKIITLYDQIAQKIKSIDNSTLKKAFQDIGAEQVKELKAEVTSLQSKLADLTKSSSFAKGLGAGFNNLKEQIKDAGKDVQDLVKKFGNQSFGKTFLNNIDTGRLDLATKTIERMREQVNQLQDSAGKTAMNEWLDGLSNGLKELQQDGSIQNIVKNLEEAKKNLSGSEAKIVDALVKGFRDGTLAVDEFGNVIVKATGDLNNLNASQAQFNQEVDQLKSRVKYFFGLNNAINLVKRTMRSAVQTIKDLDKAMTATAVVTDFTVGDMWAQLPEYTKRANELGVSTQAVYEASTLYYQQGLKTEQVMALSNETLKMARIAGLDAADATDRMTNALRGFNMELNETNAQRVNDVYSKLAAISASNVDEISTAMTKVASLAHNAGMEFETTAAFLAQIIETTRESAETAGTALKTVVARFSEVKKLVSSNQLKGQDEEGQGIDVNRVSAALKTAGIDLNKYFIGEVDLDDIFIELASKWDSLSTLQQRYIATQAAGSRQQSRFIALMSDYARTQELVGEAYKSNGAAAKQFAKTQESLESKLAKLKNAWDQFAMGILNNDVVKIVVDFLTVLLNLVNELTSGFGHLNEGFLGFVGSLLKTLTLVGSLKLGRSILDSGFASAFGKVLGKGIGQAATEVITETITDELGKTTTKTIIKNGVQETAGSAAKNSFLPKLGKAALITTTAIAAIVGAQKLYKFIQDGDLRRAQNALNKTKKENEQLSKQINTFDTLQITYEEKTIEVTKATTTEDYKKAIEERNQAIKDALKEDQTLAKYVITEEIDGEIVLTIDEKSFKNFMQGLKDEIAQKTVDEKVLEIETLEQQIKSLSNEMKMPFGWAKTWSNVQQDEEYLAYIHPYVEKYGDASPEAYAAAAQYIMEHDNSFLGFASDTIHSMLGGDTNAQSVLNTVEQIYSLQLELEQKKYELFEAALELAGQNLTDAQKINIIPILEKAYENNKDILSNADALQEIVNYILANPEIQSILEAIRGPVAFRNTPLVDTIFDDFYSKNFSQELIQGLSDATGGTITIEEIESIIESNFNEEKKTQLRNFARLEKNLSETNRGLNWEIDRQLRRETEPQKIIQLLDITDLLKEILSYNAYKEINIEELLNSENLDEVQIFLKSIDLNDPINAFLTLQKALKSGTPIIQDYAKAILDSHKVMFSPSNLIKNFYVNADDELKESLIDLIEENGKITPENIKELAKANKELNDLLETGAINVIALANALTLIENGVIGFDSLTDSLVAAISSSREFESILSEIDAWIEKYQSKDSQTKGAGHIESLVEEAMGYIETGSLGDVGFINVYDALFGEGSYAQILNSIYGLREENGWSDEETINALVAAYTENLQNLNNLAVGQAGETLDLLATAKVNTGLEIISKNGETTNYKFNGKDFKSLDEFWAAQYQALEDAGYGDLPDEVKKALITSAYSPIMGFTEWYDAAAYKDDLYSFLENNQILTRQDLEGFAALYGKDLSELISDINVLEGLDFEIKIPLIVDWELQDGEKAFDVDLKDKIEELYHSKYKDQFFDILEDALVSDENGKYYDVDLLEPILYSMGLAPEQFSDFMDYLLTYASTYYETEVKLGRKITSTPYVNNYDNENVVKTDAKIVTGSSVQDLEDQVTAEQQKIQDFWDSIISTIPIFTMNLSGLNSLSLPARRVTEGFTTIPVFHNPPEDEPPNEPQEVGYQAKLTNSDELPQQVQEAISRGDPYGSIVELNDEARIGQQISDTIEGDGPYNVTVGLDGSVGKQIQDSINDEAPYTIPIPLTELYPDSPDAIYSRDFNRVFWENFEAEQGRTFSDEERIAIEHFLTEEDKYRYLLNTKDADLARAYHDADPEHFDNFPSKEIDEVLAYLGEFGMGVPWIPIVGADGSIKLIQPGEYYQQQEQERETQRQQENEEQSELDSYTRDNYWSGDYWQRAAAYRDQAHAYYQTPDYDYYEYLRLANNGDIETYNGFFAEALKILYGDLGEDVEKFLVTQLSGDQKAFIINQAYESGKTFGTKLGEVDRSTVDYLFQGIMGANKLLGRDEFDFHIDGSELLTSIQDTLNQKEFDLKVNLDASNLSISFLGITLTPQAATGGIVGSYASGRHRKLKPGMALTGEEAPEIVWNKEKGYAYITGAHGPQFQNLRSGDQIFNGEDTKKILGNSSRENLFGSYLFGSEALGEVWNWLSETLFGSKTTKKETGGGGGGGGSKSSDEWKNELDWLYDLMEDIAEEEHKQTLIQSEYELAEKDLSKTGRDLFNLTKDELDTLQTQLSAQEFAFEKRLQQMNELQQKVVAEGFEEYLKWNGEDNTLEINWDKINEITDKDTYDKLSELVSDMEKVQGQMDEAQETQLDIKKQIQELQTRYLQAFLDFQDRVMEAVVAQYQQNIDDFSTLNDTINESAQSILDSIQKEIDLQRQIRDNTKTEEEIADLETKIAFLLRDSTGSNEQELQELQKQLKEARESYSDTLVDQAIDRLSKNNEDASSQREKQIELLQAQLDYWKETGALWGEVADLIAGGFTSQGSIIQGSELWEFLKNKDSWNGLSEAQKVNWANDLIGEANQVGAYFYQFSDNGTITAQEIIDSIIGEHGLAGEITTETRIVRAQLNELIKQLGGTPVDSIPGEGGYARGGLNTRTGLAMLHGTPNEPEYVLNARQTDAFLRLADVLPTIFSGNGINSSIGGNVYVDLTMNVGEIGSDYDVDRMVARVKEDIYSAASYRNVNAVSFLR